MVPTELDPRIGGTVSFDLGDYTSIGVVTDYTPNQRFAYEEPWPISPDAANIPEQMKDWFDSKGVALSAVQRDLLSITPIATEFLVEANSGGTCSIRVVSSAFGTGAD